MVKYITYNIKKFTINDIVVYIIEIYKLLASVIGKGLNVRKILVFLEIISNFYLVYLNEALNMIIPGSTHY